MIRFVHALAPPAPNTLGNAGGCQSESRPGENGREAEDDVQRPGTRVGGSSPSTEQGGVVPASRGLEQCARSCCQMHRGGSLRAGIPQGSAPDHHALRQECYSAAGR